MKKLSIVFAFFLVCTVAANAQEFKPFKVGLGTGYAMPSGKGAKAGVLFYLEPAYRIQDQIQVGLRMEFAAMARGFSEDVGEAEFKISTAGSYTLNGQYYFNNNNFRPFVGVGFGIYSIKAAQLDISGADGDLGLSDESKFGFYPRVGFDAGHFQLTLDYNLVGATKVEGFAGEFKNSYLGIRLGVSIGGGRN